MGSGKALTDQVAFIRLANADDSDSIAGLLCELGFPAPAGVIAGRIGALQESGERVLVAVVAEEVVGVLTAHVTPVLHRPTPVGRITMLVVASKVRHRGVGRSLAEAAENRLAEAGCGLVEVTSNEQLKSAHAFYEGLKYTRTSVRFVKRIDSCPSEPTRR